MSLKSYLTTKVPVQRITKLFIQIYTTDSSADYIETFYIEKDKKTLPFGIFEKLWGFFHIPISLINHIPGFHQPFLGESCLLQFCWFLRCLSRNQIDPEYLHHHYSKEKCLLKQMCCQANGLKILHYRYHSISSHRPRRSSERNNDHLNTTVHLI